jgi:1-aminocyclopropane-1-carboxylate deaminase
MMETQEIDISSFTRSGIKLYVKRLDKIHPLAGGNKYFKLKYNLLKAKESGFKKIVTFGGAYSNHIAALAYAGKKYGFETIGVIRGEKESSDNPTLKMASQNGMQLLYVDRSAYRNYTQSGLTLFENDPLIYILPEGGSNYEGVKGCTEILGATDHQYSDLAIACGTGATAAGIIIASHDDQRIAAFSILNDRGFLEINIRKWLHLFKYNSKNNWEIIHDFHFGGYAKKSAELECFIDQFNKSTGIVIEPVYTGKLFFGLIQKINEGHFKPGSKILAIHTGGLQYLNSEFHGQTRTQIPTRKF